jgi:tRNA pseudouridine55 synthase
MYSALKYRGHKLYELARRGYDIKREARSVSVKEIEILDISLPNVSFRLTCSKGTYVRQLASDIGDTLGCGAYLSGLRRTRSGTFTLRESIGMEELDRMGIDELEKRLFHL